MLRVGPIARQRAMVWGVGGTALVGGTTGTAAYYYSNSESTIGIRRGVQFWSAVSPIVFDYWWNSFSSSPKVKYAKWKKKYERQQEQQQAMGGQEKDGNVDTDDYSLQTLFNEDVLKTLDERNAPKMFQLMLDLGGMYIKLGQVLSVTTLPIPEKYRDYFRTLQSNVPGHEEFESVIRPTLEKEFNMKLEDVFEYMKEVPAGAASIGQAHQAKLKETGEEVIVKVQYPDAKWKVPADIQCVGQFLQLCIWFDLVDETGAKMSYGEFSRQFLSELDYVREQQNLYEIYQTSIDPKSPYQKLNVIVPCVFPKWCTKNVITMTYLPGPKFEEEAKQQLAMLGVDVKKNMRSIIQELADEKSNNTGTNSDSTSMDTTTTERLTGTGTSTSSSSTAVASFENSWKYKVAKIAGNWIGIDSLFSLARFVRRVVLWSTATAVTGIQFASSSSSAPSSILLSPLSYIIPSSWKEWAESHQHAALQAARISWTQDAVHALLDVHGYQVFNSVFNADPHPGNILIVQDDDDDDYNDNKKVTNDKVAKRKNNRQQQQPSIGLIDFGQCKRLTPQERVMVAKLIISVADNESDDVIATHFRDLGIKTKNDSTKFLASFAKLMFGEFKPEYFNHSFHKELHRSDRVTYFPKELSLVYRTSLLLRGLAMSLQMNVSVSKSWKKYAVEAIEIGED